MKNYDRYIINFGDRSEEEARQWPELLKIVEEKVKPERLTKAADVANWPWWKFWRIRKELYDAIEGRDRIIALSRVSQYLSLTFLPTNMVFTEGVVIFNFDTYTSFSLLQSRPHEIWTRFFSSSMKDDLRYTPSTCFETFPFPKTRETDPTLESIGQEYYDYRANLMVRNNQGLTDTYNRFHAPQETDPEILKLRDLHSQMDRAVLNAYGWPDVNTTCGFALDYLDIDENNLPPAAQDRIASGDLYFPTATEAVDFDNLIQSSRKTRKKLPWRYRWPETTHDEVLARLLDLNQQRYDEEVKAGLHNKKKTKKKKAKKSSTPSKITKGSDKHPIQPDQEQLNLL